MLHSYMLGIYTRKKRVERKLWHSWNSFHLLLFLFLSPLRRPPSTQCSFPEKGFYLLFHATKHAILCAARKILLKKIISSHKVHCFLPVILPFHVDPFGVFFFLFFFMIIGIFHLQMYTYIILQKFFNLKANYYFIQIDYLS